jgi:hypothetical protein
LYTSSSRVFINGVVGLPIKHGRGLRQGDPLSPLLFMLTIELLQQLLKLATRNGLLQKKCGHGNIIRTSLYANDAVFVSPIKDDIWNLSSILEIFGKATRLATNLQKSMVTPIRCQNINLDEVLIGLPIIQAFFHMKYLGLPLSV